MGRFTREEPDAACQEFGITLEDSLREQRKLRYAGRRNILMFKETTYGTTPAGEHEQHIT